MLKTEPEFEPQVELDTQPTGVLVRYPDGTRFALQMPVERATVGAGAGCTIPIRYKGVAPLHCVLFSTPTGWRIRRWSAETKLNGETFAESPVDAGDRLQVGPVEIDFLGETEPALRDEIYQAMPAEEIFSEAVVDRGLSWEAIETLVDDAISKQSAELDQLRGRLSASSDLVEESLAECRVRMREHTEQFANVEQAREALSADLAAQFRQIEELRNLVESQCDRFQEVSDDRRELSDRIAAIQAEFTQLEQHHATIPDLLAEQERRLDEIRAQGEANSIRHEQSESSFCGLQDQIAELREIIATGKLFETDVAERLTELSQQLELLRDRVEEGDCWKQQWEGNHQDLNDQIDELRQELTNVRQFENALPELKTELERQVDDVRGRINGVSEQQRQSDVAAIEFREKLDEVRRELTSRGEEVSAFHESTAEQARQSADLLDQVATISSRLEHSGEGLNELRKQFDGLLQQSTSDQSVRSDDREAMAKLERDLQEVRNDFANASVDRRQLENEISELRDSLQTVREELAAGQQIQASARDWKEDLHCRWESLQTQMEAISSQNEQYGASLSELRERLDVSNDLATDKQKTIQSVQEALTQQGRELEELREQTVSNSVPVPDTNLQSELESLRGELQELRLDRARDEQLHLATRDAVVELERQIAERAVPVASTSGDWKPESPTVSNGFAMETELKPESHGGESARSELFASSKQSYQEPESFVNKYQHLLEAGESELIASDDVSGTPSMGAFALQLEPNPEAEKAIPKIGGGEDSIEDYMSRLLQRVRGETCAVAPTPVPKVTAAPVASTGSTVESIPVPTINPVCDLQEIKSAPAPERSRDMTALRALANSSARHSLHEAKVRRSREYALVKLFVSVFAVICGYIVMGLAPSYTSPEFIGGLVPVIAGVIWGGKTIVVIFQAIRVGSFDNLDRAKEPPSEIPVDLSADEL